MADPGRAQRLRLGKLLAVAFVAVLFLGAGPGLLLINPDINDPQVSTTFAGLPKVYAWALFCYALEVVIVVIAYSKVWRDDDEPNGRVEASEVTVD
jgi:hypothetical protein